jgi:hypothetical protein
MMGKQILMAEGNTSQLNSSLATGLKGLSSGAYILHSIDAKGNSQKIKVQKK